MRSRLKRSERDLDAVGTAETGVYTRSTEGSSIEGIGVADGILRESISVTTAARFSPEEAQTAPGHCFNGSWLGQHEPEQAGRATAATIAQRTVSMRTPRTLFVVVVPFTVRCLR